jgi:FixJ family two-component response regulator
MDKNPFVFIVDDDPNVRDALSLIISQENIPVRAFSNGHDFLAAFSEESIGCAIIDLKMPGMDGIELQKAMLEHQISLPIIFLTGYGDIPTSVQAIKNGAINFLTKPVNTDDLLNSIRLAILESLEAWGKNKTFSDCHSRIERLTERELDVMKLAIEGMPNKVIANKLGISHRTVEIHKSKIIYKTGAINLLHLAQIAREAGFNSKIDKVHETELNNIHQLKDY